LKTSIKAHVFVDQIFIKPLLSPVKINSSLSEKVKQYISTDEIILFSSFRYMI